MKPLLRVGMELATVRYVAVDKPFEALPGQPVPLAPPKQGVPPCAANLTAETLPLPRIWDETRCGLSKPGNRAAPAVASGAYGSVRSKPIRSYMASAFSMTGMVSPTIST
jgi:hypothetical protein